MHKEIVGDHVTMQVQEIIDHYGDIIVRRKVGTAPTTRRTFRTSSS